MLTQVSLFSALIRLADMLGRWDARKYVNSSSFDVRIAGVFGLCWYVGLLTVACLTSGRFVNGSVKGIQFPNMLGRCSHAGLLTAVCLTIDLPSCFEHVRTPMCSQQVV